MKRTVPAPARPSIKTIPLFDPCLKGNEWKYVKECLDTNWVSSVGSYVERFETMMAQYVGMRHAVATVNGTAALHIALLVAGVQPDEEVLVSTLTFIAPANAVRYIGAHPVFMDAEPEFFQIDVAKTLEFLEKQCSWSGAKLMNKTTGRRVRAIMPVDVLGHPADVAPLLEAARKFNLLVLEDASESMGSRYRGNATGKSADISCFSYNGNKLVTTGGGGMLVTNNAEWAKRARHLTTQAKCDAVEYIHDMVGYNYRLTNVLSAIGAAQLEQLKGFVAAKRKLAGRYEEAMRDMPGVTPMKEASWAQSTFWMYTVLIDEKRFGMDSRALIRRLAEHGIMARPLWQPMHLSPAHAGSQSYRCEVAERLYRDAISLPSSVSLSETQQRKVISVLRQLAA
jgi:perosamine synthetase